MAEEPNHPFFIEMRSHEGDDSRGGVTFFVELLSEEKPRLSLDACFLCRRPLDVSSDVFMYRGDTPFCSEDCRQEQIELDAAREWEHRHRRKTHHRRPSLHTSSPRPRYETTVAV